MEAKKPTANKNVPASVVEIFARQILARGEEPTAADLRLAFAWACAEEGWNRNIGRALKGWADPTCDDMRVMPYLNDVLLDDAGELWIDIHNSKDLPEWFEGRVLDYARAIFHKVDF